MSSSLKGNRVNVMIFPNSASFAAALVCYLPSSGPSIRFGVHTLMPRENRDRPEFEIYLKIFEKTQYLINTLYLFPKFLVIHPFVPSHMQHGPVAFVLIRL